MEELKNIEMAEEELDYVAGGREIISLKRDKDGTLWFIFGVKSGKDFKETGKRIPIPDKDLKGWVDYYAGKGFEFLHEPVLY